MSWLPTDSYACEALPRVVREIDSSGGLNVGLARPDCCAQESYSQSLRLKMTYSSSDRTTMTIVEA